jgi:hypothetical protein
MPATRIERNPFGENRPEAGMTKKALLPNAMASVGKDRIRRKRNRESPGVPRRRSQQGTHCCCGVL